MSSTELTQSLFDVEPPKKKFPLFYMIIMMFDSFCNGLFTTMVTPLVPFMIKQFFPEIQDSEVGYYAGYLTSFTFLAQIPGLFIWGYLADTCGRKFAISFCFLGVSIGIGIFGLSTSYTMALIGRMLWGLFDGTWSLMKTSTSEFCGEEHVAMGLSLLTTGYGFGTVVGPFVAGYFSNMDNLLWLKNIFPSYANYQFLWPCLFVLLCIFIAIILFLCFIPETLTPERIQEIKFLKERQSRNVSSSIDSNLSVTTEDNLVQAYKNDSYWVLIRDKYVLVTAALYGFLSLVQTTHDVIESLLLLNPTDQDGFAMNSEEMGYIFMFTGILRSMSPLCVHSSRLPILYPLMTHLLKNTTIYTLFGLLYTVGLFVQPFASLLNTADPNLQWYVAFMSYAWSIMTRIIAFSASYVLIANSGPPDFRSKSNAIQEVLGGLGKFIGPSIGTTLFAWSCNNNLGFPLDYHFTFFLLGVIAFLTSLLPYLLDDSINIPKDELRVACKTHRKHRIIQTESDLDKSDIASITNYINDSIQALEQHRHDSKNNL